MNSASEGGTHFPQGVVVIRNGEKLCERCRTKGCNRHLDRSHDVEVPYVSDEPCSCCGPDDFETDDEFGV